MGNYLSIFGKKPPPKKRNALRDMLNAPVVKLPLGPPIPPPPPPPVRAVRLPLGARPPQRPTDKAPVVGYRVPKMTPVNRRAPAPNDVQQAPAEPLGPPPAEVIAENDLWLNQEVAVHDILAEEFFDAEAGPDMDPEIDPLGDPDFDPIGDPDFDPIEDPDLVPVPPVPVVQPPIRAPAPAAVLPPVPVLPPAPAQQPRAPIPVGNQVAPAPFNRAHLPVLRALPPNANGYHTSKYLLVQFEFSRQKPKFVYAYLFSNFQSIFNYVQLSSIFNFQFLICPIFIHVLSIFKQFPI